MAKTSQRTAAGVVLSVDVRQVEHEEPRLAVHPTNDDRRFAKVGLCMAGRMRQRNKHFLATPLALTNIVLDDRVAAGEAAFLTQPVENPLGRMALLAWNLLVLFQPTLDGRNKCIQLRAAYR